VRYRRRDRSKGSVGGFGDEQAALKYQEGLECDRRRGLWAEPSGFKTTLAEWVCRWWRTLDLDVRTLENYERSLRLHILPRFGHRPMGAIVASDIALWKLNCAESGYAHSTISGWVNLLSMIFTDAADEGLIPANPVRKLRRRAKRVWSARPERIWATPREVRRVADQAGELGGPTARLLIITAGWTGCRWGELAGLHRRNVDLEFGVIKIDREAGTLHESKGKRWVGPPKTPSSARTIPPPPFLITLLREHLDHPGGAWLDVPRAAAQPQDVDDH
jgi:integrase